METIYKSKACSIVINKIHSLLENKEFKTKKGTITLKSTIYDNLSIEVMQIVITPGDKSISEILYFNGFEFSFYDEHISSPFVFRHKKLNTLHRDVKIVLENVIELINELMIKLETIRDSNLFMNDLKDYISEISKLEQKLIILKKERIDKFNKLVNDYLDEK